MTSSKHTQPTLLWLSRRMGKAKLYIALLMALQMLLGFSSVCYAMLLRQVINEAVGGDRNGFFTAIWLFALLALAQICMRAAVRFLEEYSRSGLENRLKEKLFSALLTKRYASVAAVHSGEWMNRLTSDTVVVADGLTQILPNVAGLAVKMVGALAAILYLEPRFVYLLIPGGIALMALSYVLRKTLKNLHKKIQEADGRVRVFFQERLGSMMIVRSFARERQTEQQANERMQAHQDARIRRNHFANASNFGFGLILNAAYVLGAGYCGYGILTGTMSYGNFMAILQLIGQIQNPFANISGYLPKYYAMIASAERLMEAELFENDSDHTIPEEQILQFYADDFKGITMERVCFTYVPPTASENQVQMPVVISNLDLELKKGEFVAFTGPSGCGKSTVLKLLMCLYPVDAGQICLCTDHGNQPMTSAWRGLFAYVPQGNQLLSGSIREIITFGDAEKMHQDDRLKLALKVACADGFVQELERGLDTVLGERGSGLSEGQMQRIAIARAVFSDHPILLLDEATSSLDESTERAVLDNLRSMTDKTVIIVTHRPAAREICDKEIQFEVRGVEHEL